MLEAPPPPALEMIQPEFVLEFLVVAFDAPPQLREADEVSDRDRLRQRRQPVLRRLGVARGPLDQQPLFGPGRGALVVANAPAGRGAVRTASASSPGCLRATPQPCPSPKLRPVGKWLIYRL